MKPGMQRDLLVAFWLLFDEFEIGEDSAPAQNPNPGERNEDPKTAKNGAGSRSKTLRNNRRS